MLIKKLFFIILICLIITLPNIFAEDTTDFILFGHTYVDYFALNKSIDKINSINPDFIVFLGDSVEDGSEESWERFFEMIEKFESKVYMVPGNHDITNEKTLKYFKEDISKLNYEFSYEDNQFIVLDTHNFDVSSEQIDLLKSCLDKDYKNRFILMHHCLWSNKGKEICNYNIKDSVWNSEIVPLLKDKINKVFVGDVGNIVPYFFYKNKYLDYMGIGFSGNLPREPQFCLYATIKDKDLSVKPLLLTDELDLVKGDGLEYYSYDGFKSYSYTQEPVKSFIYLFITRNLKISLFFIIIISGLIGILFYIIFRKSIKRRRRKFF